MPIRSLVAGTPLDLNFAIASAVVKPCCGMPLYEVSGECGAVGPCLSHAPKKSYVITLYQLMYFDASP